MAQCGTYQYQYELDEELQKHREVPFKCPVSECDFDNQNGSIFQLIKH